MCYVTETSLADSIQTGLQYSHSKSLHNSSQSKISSAEISSSYNLSNFWKHCACVLSNTGLHHLHRLRTITRWHSSIQAEFQQSLLHTSLEQFNLATKTVPTDGNILPAKSGNKDGAIARQFQVTDGDLSVFAICKIYAISNIKDTCRSSCQRIQSSGIL